MSRALDGVQLVVENEMQLRAARAAGATNVRLKSAKVDRAQLASMGFMGLKCHLLRSWISTNGLSTVAELLDRHDECWGRDPSSFPLYIMRMAEKEKMLFSGRWKVGFMQCAVRVMFSMQRH